MKDYIKILIYVALLVILILVAKKSYDSLTIEQLPIEVEVEASSVNSPEDEKIEIKNQEELEKALDFVVIDSDGNKVSLFNYIGKPIVVNFWATWCGPCRSELPAFENLSKKYDGQVEFLMVNLTDGFSETIDNAQRFINENQYTFPVYFDTESSAAYVYDVSSIPETVFINEEGYIVNSHIGAMSEKVLETYIKQLIKDESNVYN